VFRQAAVVSLVLLATVAAVSGCGRIHDGGTATASPTTSPASSSTPTPTASPAYAIAPGNCVAPASGTASQPLGQDKVVVDIPPGWTQVSTGASETVALQMNAPPGYANQPTSIRVQTFIGNYNGQTAHSVAVSWASEHSIADSNSIADCSVAGGAAAYVQYRGNGLVGYQFFMVRVDAHYDRLARLWGLNLEGTGGLDSNSVADAMRVLGSWRWGV
jgi:hypothetical protein